MGRVNPVASIRILPIYILHTPSHAELGYCFAQTQKLSPSLRGFRSNNELETASRRTIRGNIVQLHTLSIRQSIAAAKMMR